MIINWNKENDKVSKYFRVSEVTQSDVRRKPKPNSIEEKNILYLAKKLDDIRTRWGSSIGVTSWYRPYHVNLEVGGVANSQHITGGAVDIYNHLGDSSEFESFLDDYWYERALGYGIRSGLGFTHLDLRKGKIRWDY